MYFFMPGNVCLELGSGINETGLQPVSRPVEQILGFYRKVLKRDYSQRV